jgi:hypothetical protein
VASNPPARLIFCEDRARAAHKVLRLITSTAAGRPERLRAARRSATIE